MNLHEPGTKVRVRTAVAENDFTATVLKVEILPGRNVMYKVGWTVGSEWVHDEFPACMVGENEEKKMRIGFFRRAGE